MSRGNFLRKLFFLALFATVASVCVCVAQEDKAVTERLEQKYESVKYIAYNEYQCYYVKLNGKEGMCDLKGNEIIPCKYSWVGYDEKGRFHIVALNKKIGACDLNGHEVVPCQYDYVYKEGDNFIVVTLGTPGQVYVPPVIDGPLRQPQKSPCSGCGGSGICKSCNGKGWTMTCGACNGKGKKMNRAFSDSYWGTCDSCNGKGTNTCSSCSGTGKCQQCRGVGSF